MKRYDLDWVHGAEESVDGEFIRYEDHCDAMKRMAREPEGDESTDPHADGFEDGLAAAAFYVEDHCHDGEHHARIIERIRNPRRATPPPAMSAERAASAQQAAPEAYRVGGDLFETRSEALKAVSLGVGKAIEPLYLAPTPSASPVCSECRGTGTSDGRDGALIPCLACKPSASPASAQQDERVAPFKIYAALEEASAQASERMAKLDDYLDATSNVAASDNKAVDAFATAMKEKLAIARKKGRGGWQGCSTNDLSRMLREHVEKGDPRDVANFCMFLWHLDASIARAAQQVQAEGDAVAVWYIPDDNGKPFKTTGYPEEAAGWRTAGHDVRCIVRDTNTPPATDGASTGALTDEQIRVIWDEHVDWSNSPQDGLQFARAVLAASPAKENSNGNA